MGLDLLGACGFSSAAFVDSKSGLKKKPLPVHRAVAACRKGTSKAVKQLNEMRNHDFRGLRSMCICSQKRLAEIGALQDAKELGQKLIKS